MRGKLFLDDQIIEHYLELNKTPNTEFEIRFQDIKQYQFDMIRSKLHSPHHVITSKSYILNDGVRVEVFDKNKIDFVRKSELDFIVLYISNLRVKLNCSKEQKISPVKYQIPKKTRTKYRSVYNFDGYHIDLTFVKTEADKKHFDTFELEIEYDKNATVSTVRKSLIKIFSILYPDRYSYIESSIESDVRGGYAKLFGKSYKSNLGKSNFIYETKASNFKEYKMKSFNHSITNKLNGVNFFLFTYNNGVYLLNHSTIDYVGKIGDISTTLIQGELYKGVYYVFDVLWVNGVDVREFNHKKRLDEFEKYIHKFDELGVKLEYKIFYRSDNNYQNLMDCMSQLSLDKNGEIDMEMNDGFIFTPLNEPYMNTLTWKYKFPETMTNDFSVEKDPSGIWNIFVYDQNKTLIPFKYNGIEYKMKYDGHDIRNNMIVECHFNKNIGFFVPYRVRHDKVLPNFYKVAIDNFDDIMLPMTILDLKRIFVIPQLDKFKKLELMTIFNSLFPERHAEINKKMRKQDMIKLFRK